jgi:DNA-directed RNA polymerase specialized sigma24 family protein
VRPIGNSKLPAQSFGLNPPFVGPAAFIGLNAVSANLKCRDGAAGSQIDSHPGTPQSFPQCSRTRVSTSRLCAEGIVSGRSIELPDSTCNLLQSDHAPEHNVGLRLSFLSGSCESVYIARRSRGVGGVRSPPASADRQGCLPHGFPHGGQFPSDSRRPIPETYLRLCARDFRALRSFEHRHEGAFLGFVQVVAANIVRDHFRSVHRNKQTPAELAVEEKLLAAPREAAGGIESMERRVLIREIDSQLNLCTTGPNQERNRRIFWLHYRSGLSACEIAALPGIGLGPKGVETLILRLRRELGAALARPRESKRSAAVRHDEGNESVKTL